MKSMTGYGSAEYSSVNLELEVNIRSVNGRYFEPRMHLPREYQALEAVVRKKINSYIKRGTVDIYVNRKAGGSFCQHIVKVNIRAAKKWQAAYRELNVKLKLSDKIGLQQVANQPGVIQSVEKSKLSVSEKTIFLSQLERALKNCDRERAREGRALQADLKKQLTQLKTYANKMGQLKVKAGKELKKRYTTRLNKLGAEGLDPARFAQEVTVQLDKADISEEIVRLNEHLKSFLKLITIQQAQGKKMDFYCQELLREVNTIGSKSQMAVLTQIVVDAKSTIEKLREQVQNIE